MVVGGTALIWWAVNAAANRKENKHKALEEKARVSGAFERMPALWESFARKNGWMRTSVFLWGEDGWVKHVFVTPNGKIVEILVNVENTYATLDSPEPFYDALVVTWPL